MSIVIIVGLLSLISSLLLFFSTFLTFPLFSKTRDEIFFHMTLVLFLFAVTLLVTGFFAISLPETMFIAFQDLGLMKLHDLIKIILLFMFIITIEFSFLYTNLSSNRLFFIEKYFPIVPALLIGLLSASMIVENEALDTVLFYGVYMIVFLVDIMIIVLLIRLRIVRKKFSERVAERALLTNFLIMLFAFLIYQSADLIGFIGILFSLDLYILASLAQIILLPIFGALLLFQSLSIWKILDRINYSLLLNELN
ncbi:MAG: hypothetical protein ACFE9L_15930 [Candidatus Hodarchaeota archaeon]